MQNYELLVMGKRRNLITEKTFYFALDVIKLYKKLVKKHEFIMSRQILRSGTAVGAVIREAECAESKRDFVHKISIARKEINETGYWIELLYRSNYVDDNEYTKFRNDAAEISKLMTSIILTVKRRYGLWITNAECRITSD